MSDRYDTSGSPEGQFQPGSDDRVLLNRLGINDPQEMEDLEFDRLVQCQRELFDDLSMDQQITVNDLCDWHRRWLGSVYDWAGNYRTVTMSRDGFPFAAVPQLPRLMQDFERKYLQVYTPCHAMNRDELVEAMAICHVEFIVIHPFRDGNGRLGRLLATVMALQAGMPVLDFEPIEKDKGRYIEAIHAGHTGDYEPMKRVFSEVLDFSLQQTSRNESSE
ncbi:MAG TPA: cell filamentation protein Fic [Gammaproteobacteria bacterium]|nr:cell filamentation protein Fic [Gammaproteobacteria bacterium]